jgi:hypothetical protein
MIKTRIKGARFFLSRGHSGTPAVGEVAPTDFALEPGNVCAGGAKGAAIAGAGTMTGAAVAARSPGNVGAVGNVGAPGKDAGAGTGVSKAMGGGGRPMPDIVGARGIGGDAVGLLIASRAVESKPGAEGAGGRGFGSSGFEGSIPGADAALARTGATGGAAGVGSAYGK